MTDNERAWDFLPDDVLAERDLRIRHTLDEVVADVAMWVVAKEIDETPDVLATMEAVGYERLHGLCRHDLERAVMLLIVDTRESEQQAKRILRGLRKATT